MKLVILDRNGTINVHREDFVKSDIEWTPLPGALEAVARLNHAGWHVVIASNQSGLGRGLFDVASLNAMHAKMHKMLAAVGGRVDAVFYCPHSPDEDCGCRKPKPGLFLQIGERYGVDLTDVPTCRRQPARPAGRRGRRLRAAPAAHRHGRGLPQRRPAAARIPAEHAGARRPRRPSSTFLLAREARRPHCRWLSDGVCPFRGPRAVDAGHRHSLGHHHVRRRRSGGAACRCTGWRSAGWAGPSAARGSCWASSTRVTGMENLPTGPARGRGAAGQAPVHARDLPACPR